MIYMSFATGLFMLGIAFLLGIIASACTRKR
jgi:hypothetical protein